MSYRKAVKLLTAASLVAVVASDIPARPGSLASYLDAEGAISETLLQTTRSWDGELYKPYASGQPEVSVLRIYIPPHSALAWHLHPVINAAYVLTGKLFVEKKSDGTKREVNAGDVLPEMVNDLHRGYTEDQSAMLIVFYAGIEGIPITVPEAAAAAHGKR
jgi:quercetin dioxygenase-like cupin family protein